MKFKIVNYGDKDVGIEGFEYEIDIPNPGFDEDHWIDSCKNLLNDLYNSEIRGDVFSKRDLENEDE